MIIETLNADSIVASITAVLSNYPGRPHSDFYVGITNNLDQRLGEHRVTREDCLRILRATNHDEAHLAESTLINIHHMTGKVGGEAPDSVWVYCYEITDTTIESTNDAQ